VEGCDKLGVVVKLTLIPRFPVQRVGKAGATNAGILAAQMLAMSDQTLAHNLDLRREATKVKVFESNGDLI
jgi:5-(carboxyamino)imidazole ribonucleotide mutase